MSNNSSYQLRMEMIQLAQQRASEKFHIEWELAARRASINENASQLEMPSYPTTEELLLEADKIKKFVDDRQCR